MRFRSPNFYDKPIFETANFAALPSLGGFVEGWTLIVPKHPALNVQAVPKEMRGEFRGLARRVRAAVEKIYGEASFFEHGPVEIGSLMGCGTDQAHLHVVPFVFSELPKADAEWVSVGGEFPFDGPTAESDYLWVAAKGSAHVCHPETVTSQFFREKIAESLGVTASWDYKLRPCHETLRATSERLSAALNA